MTATITCPSWCSAEHDGEHPGEYAHTTSATTEAIETIDPRDGYPGILFVDLEQTQDEREARLILHGTAIREAYTLDDAERIACQILQQVMTARARQAVTS